MTTAETILVSRVRRAADLLNRGVFTLDSFRTDVADAALDFGMSEEISNIAKQGRRASSYQTADNA